MAKNKIQICKTCGQQINAEWGLGFVVNEGIEGKEYVECELCHDESLDSHRIIICEHCGAYFSRDVLKDEVVCGESFCACPACGHDIVEGMSREEFMAEYGQTDEAPGLSVAVDLEFEIDNQRQIVLEQSGEEDTLAVTIWSAPDKDGNRGCEEEYTIGVKDFMSMLNWYRLQKEQGNTDLRF